MPQAIIAMLPMLSGVAATGVVAAPGVLKAAESKAARKSTESLMKEQQRKQDEYLSDLEKDQEEEKSGKKSLAARNKAKTLQRQRAAGARGRRSTILTSPLGVVGAGSTTRKTILGV